MVSVSEPKFGFKNPHVVLRATMLFLLIHSNSLGSIYNLVGWFGFRRKRKWIRERYNGGRIKFWETIMWLITVLVKIFGETSFGEMSINTAIVYAALAFLNTSRGPDVVGIGVGGFCGIGAFCLDNFRSREMSSSSSETNDSSSLDKWISACSSCF